MSFIEEIKKYEPKELEAFCNQVSAYEIEETLKKDKLTEIDFLRLLSPAAMDYIEAMAKKARQLTLQHFGRAVLLYTPIYIANHCSNKCVYCSFNLENKIKRVKLSLDEIDQEGRSISEMGFEHILILTGEDRIKTPVSYIVESVKVLKKYFQCISIEIYPLSSEEYNDVIEAGVTGLTVYQETYDKSRYEVLHLKGPKRLYQNRLDAPERAAQQGMRFVNIGALLGLKNGPYDPFMTGLHGYYLQKKYPSTEYGVSVPRMRPHIGSFQDFTPIDDDYFVQVLLAYRLFLPSFAINVSTREGRNFREHLIPIGATNISAGVSTEVGGHSSGDETSDPQFEIADNRSLEEMKEVIKNMGYQPILKNWTGEF